MAALAALVLTYACAGCLPGGAGGIVAVRADGTHRQTIVVAPRGHFFWQPTWAPDGTRFAYVDEGKRGARRLWVARADGRAPRPLTRAGRDAFYPVWSPDGSRIAFVRDYALWTVRAGGGGERRLFGRPRGAVDEAAAWSPDGRRLAFVADDRLFGVRADGTGLVRIATHTAFGTRVSTPAWAPSRRSIFYFSGQDNAYVPWVPHRHDLDTGRDTFFLARPGPDYIAAAWSRDCRYFAYGLILPVGGAGADDLWILRFADRRRIHVTKIAGDLSGVSWRPQPKGRH